MESIHSKLRNKITEFWDLLNVSGTKKSGLALKSNQVCQKKFMQAAQTFNKNIWWSQYIGKLWDPGSNSSGGCEFICVFLCSVKGL